MTIKQETCIKKILETNGKIFTAHFIKKNGEPRMINCRLGVHRYVNGKGMSYNPKEHGLIVVFDMQKRQYRMINENTLVLFKFKGREYKVA